MADYNAGPVTEVVGGYIPDWETAAKTRSGGLGAADGELIPTTSPLPGVFEETLPTPKPFDEWNAIESDSGPGLHWFEDIHYTPESISLGNMLSTVTQEIEIYNSYRRTSQTFTSATNNAGQGISFDGLPTLPSEIQPQEGKVFDVVIDVDGPPTILGTLDFVTDPLTFAIPITGSRVVMFAWEPERPIVETLEWKTDILQAADGTEQRISWRKNPRQSMSMQVQVPEGEDRRKMMNLLRGWHARVFGVPIWWEARTLESDVAAAATSITVDTDYADYRVGGLVIIWSAPDVFDAVEIDTVNAGSLDLTSPVSNAYTAGETLVMPLRVAQLGSTVPIQTYLNALQQVTLDWRVKDNDVGDSFGDTTPYSTHNSKVMLDGYNEADGPIPEDLFRKIQTIDSEIGKWDQYSDQLTSVPVTQKGFYGGTRQAIWEARKLFHALNGSQVSFYLPTFYYDLIATEGLTASSTDLKVENTGFTDYVVGAEPYLSIWIELTDGSILTRQVTASVVVDTDNETLTVDSAWAGAVTLDEIARISLLRLVRLADDRVEITHDYPGSAHIRVAVRGAS